MTTALSLLDAWPVDHVAATVIAPSGVVAEHGEVERVFPLASVTKILSGYAALLAVQEGALGLDDPAGPPGSTLRHLLAHASGLPFDSRVPFARPGSRRIYSNAGVEMLAEQVARETGIGFHEYTAEAVFDPLGMRDVSFTGSAAWGAGAHCRDLARFAGELLAPRLLAPELLVEATNVQFTGLDGVLVGYGNMKPNDWGLGFELRGAKSPHWTGAGNSPKTFGHFGASGTFLWVDPNAQLACVVLTDRPFQDGGWAKPLWPGFSDAVLAEFAGTSVPA
ncbi:beta-lactamase [Segniliparus rotundus DSM 44985]|uniref:Beta-lactamase n=1 Tax=Segniliparus rotundus (strain ATCC BAA-972 / CDC 1076 / CIP 108378 / DSM 44985 / JCM 13578) TaxID=640132 RepID=D6ZCY8_SEGRD|nr:serine hydrolase domain-containing protein [Segniliparus rotundus]ADG99175.1 beta-lactamase [Segniliparus rotundus DSM 44985]